ncbi:MAG: hypothetical protein SVP26_02575 [Chloroflexota bacterium]|nr:hypothetical protein [Chloroflexota bacterium]
MAQAVKLNDEQQKEGYWTERSGEYVQVWHHTNQIALLIASPDIDDKVQDVVQRKRKELKEVEEKTGWKPD